MAALAHAASTRELDRYRMVSTWHPHQGETVSRPHRDRRVANILDLAGNMLGLERRLSPSGTQGSRRGSWAVS
jgi:hypothetical protein